MPFTLEAVYAGKGDALILHCGDDEEPHWMLIDGGTGVWGDFLRPRLEEIREEFGLSQLPLDVVMVSHIDDDHINGVLPLMKSVARDTSPHFTVDTLWHNSFDKLVGTASEEIVGMLDAEPSVDEGGVASVKQGIQLKDYADEAIAKGRLTLNGFFRGNADFPALVIANQDNVRPFDVGESGVRFTVLSPNSKRLREYQERWDQELKKLKLAEDVDAAGRAASVGALNPNDAFTFEDDSPYNLASIVVLAEKDGRRILLTGDATGADVLEGLVLAGHMPREALLDQAGLDADRADPKRPVARFHVDLLKVPHHGSPNNVTTGFFRRVTADHYVISGNGEHGNPNPHTLEMLREARGDEAFTIHLTVSEEELAGEADVSSKAVEGLERLNGWVTALREEEPPNVELVLRPHDDRSVFVDLPPV